MGRFIVEGDGLEPGIVGVKKQLTIRRREANVPLNLEDLAIIFYSPALPDYEEKIDAAANRINITFTVHIPGQYKVYLTYERKLIIRPFTILIEADPSKPVLKSAGPSSAPQPIVFWAAPDTPEKIFEMLNDGRKAIELDPKFRDVTLVLGISGSGKSSFVKFLVQKPSMVSEDPNDMEEFRIRDEEEEEVGTTFDSVTLYPELFKCPSSKEDGKVLALYDCAGFKDTRGPALDIVAAYFINYVINHASSLKLIFTVTYDSVKSGTGYRDDFTTMVLQVATLVKDVKKFAPGIMLIATKTHPRTPVEKIVNAIGNFILSDARKYFDTQLKEATDKDKIALLENGIAFLEALTKKNEEGVFTRIGIFRTPDAVGRLNDLPAFKANRAFVLNILEENLAYVPKEKEDFGYSVSVETKKTIGELVKIVNKDIRDGVAHIGSEMTQYYMELVATTTCTSYSTLQAKLKSDYDFLVSFVKHLETLDDMMDLFKRLSETLDAKLQINLDEKNWEGILKNLKYLEFFFLMSGEKSGLMVSDLTSPLKHALAWIDEKITWYDTLEKLFDHFSDSAVQTNVEKYISTNLKEFYSDTFPYLVDITEKNLASFLQALKYGSAKIGVITSLMADEMNKILDLTLNSPPPKIRAHNGGILATGNFIKMSEVKVKMEEARRVFATDLPSIQIFGTNTVFLDTDVEGGGSNMAIIAPRLIVEGDRKFNFVGAKGTDAPSTPAKEGNKARLRGEDGKAGGSASSGGSFLALAQRIGVGGLCVRSVGGVGGRGQAGGNGMKGQDGEDARDEPPWNAEEKWEEYFSKDRVFYKVWNTDYLVHGTSGKSGGDGGDGGRGGHGGKGGKVLALALGGNSESELTSDCLDGDKGQGGLGGKYGSGGKNGSDKEVLRERHWDFAGAFVHNTYYTTTNVIDKGSASNGENGSANSNEKGMEEQVQALNPGFSSSLNAAKSFLRESALDHPYRRDALINFILELDAEPEVRKVYDTLGLIQEFQGLEDQFYKLGPGFNSLSFYTNLLERVRSYAEASGNPSSIRDRKVLAALYTSILTKICGLKTGEEPTLVVDLEVYLEGVMEEIEELKTKTAQKAIGNYTNDYKVGLDRKAKEANDFIQTQIVPEIDKIMGKIDDQIDKFIDEVIRLQEAATKEKDKLVEAQKKLANSLVLRGVLEVLKFGATVSSFCGPIGMGVGAVVGIGVGLTETFGLDPDPDAKSTLKIPDGVMNGIDAFGKAIEKRKADKIKAWKKILKEMKDEAKEDPKNLKDLDDSLKELRERLEKKDLDEGEVQAIEDEIKSKLEGKKKSLESEIENESDKKMALKVVKNLQKLGKVVDAGMGVYNKYNELKGKMEAMGDAVEIAQAKIEKLKEFRESIEGSVAPMFQSMSKDIKDVEAKLKEKSAVALDVTKWQIQSNLKDMQLQMKKVTKDFAIQDDLLHYIEKLKDGMTTLIQLYDRIQNFQDQQKLAIFISNVSSAQFQGDLPDDPKLGPAMLSLQTSIRSNIVLLQFKTVMRSFKQWMFPFADAFLDQFTLPKSLQWNTSLADLISAAISMIKTLKKKVRSYYAEINEFNARIGSGQFISGKDATRPFYTWSNGEYGDDIYNLLEGKKVVFFADLRRSPEDKAAIKFGQINLGFGLKDGDSLKDKLEGVLKGFEIEMTHHGNSFYRFEDRTYLIVSDNLVLTYSYEEKDGEPINSNDVYKKLKDGDLMLSPYTTWSFQLREVGGKKFSDLRGFWDKIDLELTGYGKYVREEKNVLKNEEEILPHIISYTPSSMP